MEHLCCYGAVLLQTPMLYAMSPRSVRSLLLAGDLLHPRAALVNLQHLPIDLDIMRLEYPCDVRRYAVKIVVGQCENSRSGSGEADPEEARVSGGGEG